MRIFISLDHMYDGSFDFSPFVRKGVYFTRASLDRAIRSVERGYGPLLRDERITLDGQQFISVRFARITKPLLFLILDTCDDEFVKYLANYKV